MKKQSKKQVAYRTDRLVNLAIRSLRIPILQMPAIYRVAEGLEFHFGGPGEAEAVAMIREFAISKGAEVTS